MTDAASETRKPEILKRVVIRFAGDSGDGMQLVGDRFTDVSAAFGNDLATLPNYPAEIRAPAGTIAGVSSFQVHIADFDIVTPGDVPNLLVAMNPAALKANIGDLPPGASIIANTDAFEPRNLEKAGYVGNPLEDDSLAAFTVYPVPMTSITVEAAKETGAKPRDAERSKNFFALGLISLDVLAPDRPRHRRGSTSGSPRTRWSATRTSPRSRPATTSARPPSSSRHPFEVHPATLPPGRYRNITGNVALAYGLIAAGQHGEAADPLRVVPDHAGLRHPPRALEAQELRRAHDAGRGRDRRDRRRHRRRVRRPARRHRHERPRRRPQGRGARASRSASSCR